MKTLEIIWFVAIMLLCAIADSNNTVIMITLCVLAIPFVIHIIAKAAKEHAIKVAEDIKKDVKRALSEK